MIEKLKKKKHKIYHTKMSAEYVFFSMDSSSVDQNEIREEMQNNCGYFELGYTEEQIPQSLSEDGRIEYTCHGRCEEPTKNSLGQKLSHRRRPTNDLRGGYHNRPKVHNLKTY